jgi:hypothetical protein
MHRDPLRKIRVDLHGTSSPWPTSAVATRAAKLLQAGDRFDQARVAILDAADTGAEGQQITPPEE